MTYPLENLTDSDFENLVALICEKILGTATIVFSVGTDGGKDARFTGKANRYPSESKQWEGKIIIQAKHTQRPNASCSDSDFQTIIKNQVIPAIDKLIKNNEIDYYLLFTNRKLSGIQDSKLESIYSDPVHIENRLIALETIQLWLKEYPEIAKALSLNSLLLPLDFHEEDLKNIIVEFSKLDIKAIQIQEPLKFIDKESKNKLNDLSKDYFNNAIKKNLSYFNQIDLFFSDPINDNFQNMYQNTIDDLNEEILIHRDSYDKFEEILNHLYKFILDRRPELQKNRKLIRLFLHYMYYNCSIGKKE
ncbi:MAG: ABC-three component system protein [bacterium]